MKKYRIDIFNREVPTLPPVLENFGVFPTKKACLAFFRGYLYALNPYTNACLDGIYSYVIEEVEGDKI